jgi:hypothetical protein
VDIVVCIDVGKSPTAVLTGLTGYKQSLIIADPAQYSVSFSSPTQITLKYFHVQADVPPGTDLTKITTAVQSLAGYMGDYWTTSPGPLGSPTPF